MTDVVLVHPAVSIMDRVRSAPILPLALLEAASLVDRSGYKVRLIDQRVDPDWDEMLRRELKEQPLCVGVTSMTGPPIRGALAASRLVKKSGDVPVVWGGVHASGLPGQTLSHPDIDFVVQGEGEETFLELVEALERAGPHPAPPSPSSPNGGDFAEIRGLWWKDGKGQVHSNPERPFLEMNSLPDPPYHLADVRRYMPRYRGLRTFAIQTSRGCPYPCTYCYNTSFNKREWRMLSAERSVALIARAREMGAENIFFVDDEVIIERQRLEDICRGILKEGVDIRWEVQGIRVNNALRMDDAMLRLVERSGCIRLTFGVESASERVLKMVKRNIPLDQVRAINRRLRDTGIIALYNFMCGIPGETREDLKMTIRFIFELQKENPTARFHGIYIYNPYPGTELYDYCVKSGYFKPPASLEEWADLSWATTPMQFQDKKTLEPLYFLSLFVDRKYREDTFYSPVFRALAAAYGPVARFRMKHLFFRLMPEKHVVGALETAHSRRAKIPGSFILKPQS